MGIIILILFKVNYFVLILPLVSWSHCIEHAVLLNCFSVCVLCVGSRFNNKFFKTILSEQITYNKL
jgi:hypothetical protein